MSGKNPPPGPGGPDSRIFGPSFFGLPAPRGPPQGGPGPPPGPRKPPPDPSHRHFRGFSGLFGGPEKSEITVKNAQKVVPPGPFSAVFSMKLSGKNRRRARIDHFLATFWGFSGPRTPPGGVWGAKKPQKVAFQGGTPGDPFFEWGVAILTFSESLGPRAPRGGSKLSKKAPQKRGFGPPLEGIFWPCFGPFFAYFLIKIGKKGPINRPKNGPIDPLL